MASSTSTLALSDAPLAAAAQVINVEEVAKGARKGSRKLQDISSEERSAVLMQIASSLELREQEILTANMIDVEAAENRWGRNLLGLKKYLLSYISSSFCFVRLFPLFALLSYSLISIFHNYLSVDYRARLLVD
jgi:hypothetical protein